MPSTLRQQRDSERTSRSRSALLDAATRVFVHQGYHRTLISDIVADARVGQGTFYRHFPDKRTIFESVFDRFTSSLFEEFSGMSADMPKNITEYRDASVAALTSMANIVERNRDVAILLVRESQTVDAEFKSKVEALNESFVDLAQLFLDHAVAEGFARPCHTRVVARAIVGMAVMLADAWWSGRIQDVGVCALIEEVVDFAFQGIRQG